MDQAAKLPSTSQLGDTHRLCTCGNKISSMDTHQVCSACLGLEHARAAISNAGSCAHCARFTAKSLRRRLARQASLSERDPILSCATTEEPQPDEEDIPEPEFRRWGSTLDLLNPLTEPPLMLDYDEEDESDGEDCLVSDVDDEDYESCFVPSAQALSSPSSAKGSGAAIMPQPSGDMHDVCKRAAERLKIPWPAVVAEVQKSRYEGKKLPQAKRAARQLLPVFPELLEEVTVSWKQNPYSSKTTIQGASSLDVEGMDKHAMARMPPMEPLVAAHLHPRLSAASSRAPTLPTKGDRFQSAMTERAYKAAALTVRALNVTSMLSAYQAELFDDIADVPDCSAWDEITTIADICLRVQRCAVQAAGKCMSMLVLQERTRWLNLTNLSDREKEDILDMPIVPEGIFGSALASMQKRCEAKKKEDEALQLCLPRKTPAAAQPPPRQTFAQVASRSAPPAFRIPKRPRAQFPGPSTNGPPDTKPAWHKKPSYPPSTQAAQPGPAPSQQARRKRKAT